MPENASILATIRKMIGGDVESSEFDTDLLVAINSAISTLYQIGVETLGLNGGDFTVTGEQETWDDLIGNYKHIEMVKSYIYQRVRLMFDPPNNSFLTKAIQDQIQETEWRIIVALESDNKPEE